MRSLVLAYVTCRCYKYPDPMYQFRILFDEESKQIAPASWSESDRSIGLLSGQTRSSLTTSLAAHAFPAYGIWGRHDI